LDVDYEYVGYDKSWDDMQQTLEDGEIDMVTSPRKTPEREEKFDFSRPIGTNNGILTVRSDNSTIVDGNYSTYNGMRVALLNGSSRDKEFADFAGNKGFTYDPFYFDTTAEMEEALQSGNVDAIAATSMRKTNNERIVDKFDSSEFYVIVKKGNTELLNEINYAIDQMNAVEGDWKTTLYNKNYESIQTKNLEYTEKEKSIISQYSKDNPLHVLCDPTRYPYSYNENGEMKGIIPDYFRKIADYAGISYEFLTPATRDEYIAYQKNKETTDISIDARLETDNYAEAKKWGITAPFITMQLARVTRRDFDGKIDVVATIDQTASNSIEDAMAPGAEKLMCSTRQEMMEAVRKGKADAAFVYYYMAQAFVNSDTTGTMAYTLLEQPTFIYRMVISSTENHALAGILTKAMYAMPKNLVEDLAAQYTTYKATELTVVDWIRLHPVVTVLVLLIFGWLLTAMAVTMVHLSARKKAQKAAQEKAEELAEHAQAANKAKTAFLSHMSHDMRTPMNAIIGFTGIAMKNNPSDEVKNCLEKIDESSEYLLSLINDVLDLTHIESGKVKYNPVPADVKNITDSALDIIKGFLTNRDINFKIQCEDAKIPNVLADPARLRDVLVNILSNAVKFTPDGGTITFEAQCQEKGGDGYINMRYRISDTGIGMSEEFIKEVFEEFAQEDSDVRTQYHGVGLGMAIVKKYVDMMGGTISVQSKKHEGTTFTVDIPLEITDKEWNKSDPVFSEKVDLTGVNVLLAEDNELNAEIAAVQLEEFGMNVERAVDGKNAVEIFRNHPKGTFDVILMDVMMPEMNGYEATKAIRAMNDRPDGKNIPIIAMTANSFAEDVQASLDAGMNAHLSKPIVMDEVIKTILRYVR
jgi:signal transduction histidine kinase